MLSKILVCVAGFAYIVHNSVYPCYVSHDEIFLFLRYPVAQLGD